MKHSLLSLVDSEGVSINELVDKLHTSRKAIIQSVHELQRLGYEVFIFDGQVYYIKQKETDFWACIAFLSVGVAAALLFILVWVTT